MRRDGGWAAAQRLQKRAVLVTCGCRVFGRHAHRVVLQRHLQVVAKAALSRSLLGFEHHLHVAANDVAMPLTGSRLPLIGAVVARRIRP